MRGKALPRGSCPACGRHLVLARDGAIPPHKVRMDGWWGGACPGGDATAREDEKGRLIFSPPLRPTENAGKPAGVGE